MSRVDSVFVNRVGWNFPDISGGIETLNIRRYRMTLDKVGISQTSVVGLRLNKVCDHPHENYQLCWNFPDISGGIETTSEPWTVQGRNLHEVGISQTSVVGLRRGQRCISLQNRNIHVGISQTSVVRLRLFIIVVLGCPCRKELEFPRHQWWD